MSPPLPLELETQPFGPITRTTLALFAGASGDHNPIHIDIDFARRAGMPDVFAHGMLSAAYVARYLTARFGQHRLRSIDLRFSAMTPVGASPCCAARIEELVEQEGERLARLSLRVLLEDGTQSIIGEALVAAAGLKELLDEKA